MHLHCRIDDLPRDVVDFHDTQFPILAYPPRSLRDAESQGVVYSPRNAAFSAVSFVVDSCLRFVSIRL
jgi:hypothetical protein